jgi:hypothetical protein
MKKQFCLPVQESFRLPEKIILSYEKSNPAYVLKNCSLNNGVTAKIQLLHLTF